MTRGGVENPVLDRLAFALDRAVRALGRAGEPDEAARIAAEAWWLVREPAPRAARRLDATLHYLTLGKPSKQAHTRRETHVHVD